MIIQPEENPQLQGIVDAILQRQGRGELGGADGRAWREIARLWRPHSRAAEAAASGQWKALGAVAEAAEALEAALGVRGGDRESEEKRILRALAGLVCELAVLRAESGVRSAADDLVWPLLKRAGRAREALALGLALAQLERIKGASWGDGDWLLHAVDQAIARLPAGTAERAAHDKPPAQPGDLTELGVILEVESGSSPSITDHRFDAACAALRKASISGHPVRLVILREACETPTPVPYFGYSASSTPPAVAPLYGVSRYFQVGVLVDGVYSSLAKPARRFALPPFAQIEVGFVTQVAGWGREELRALDER